MHYIVVDCNSCNLVQANYALHCILLLSATLAIKCETIDNVMCTQSLNYNFAFYYAWTCIALLFATLLRVLVLHPYTSSVFTCCSTSQCVAVCCSVLQCAAVYCSATFKSLSCTCLPPLHVWCFYMLQYVAVCCSVLQCVEVCCIVLQGVAVTLNSPFHFPAVSLATLLRVLFFHSYTSGVLTCCSTSQCVAVCCSVLQCVAVCCSATFNSPTCTCLSSLHVQLSCGRGGSQTLATHGPRMRKSHAYQRTF